MNTINIIGTIGNETKVSNINPTGEISLEINSFGGDVTEAAAIINSLQKADKVNVIYTGFSASAATLIGSSFEHVAIYDNVQLLIHESRGEIYGTLNDVKSYAEFLEQTNDQMAEVYARKTGKSKEFFRELMAKNNGEGQWLTPAEALEIGLVNEIITSYKAAAIFDAELFEKAGIKPPKNIINHNSINMNILNFFKTKDAPRVVATNKGILLCANLEVGAEVAAENPDGEYETEKEKVTVEGGKITAIEEMPMPSELETLQAENEALKSEIEMLKAKLAEYEGTLEVESKEKTELSAKVAELTAKVEHAAKYIPTAQATPVKTGTNPETANQSMQSFVTTSINAIRKNKKQTK